jgi:hypothetical protein
MGFLDVMTLAIILVVVASTVFFAILLAGLPGKIARGRSHPQADAVNVAGYLSMLTLFTLWPAALIWAYCKPLNVTVVDPANVPQPQHGGSGAR